MRGMNPLPTRSFDSPATVFPPVRCTAFVGSKVLASGLLDDVKASLRARTPADGETAPPRVFDDLTGKPFEIDLREGDEPQSAAPAATAVARGPGRPRLGVIAREVTLLPRHWDWLSHQPGGASVALRTLVDDARRSDSGRDDGRGAQEAAYAFMSAMAGQLPPHELAARALFAADQDAFEAHTNAWPADIRRYTRQLAGPLFRKAYSADAATVLPPPTVLP